MSRSPRTLPVLALALAMGLSACDGGGGGDVDGDGIRVVPPFDHFDCDPATPAPECPPFACDVDAEGNVVSFEADCSPGQPQTAFVGPEGVELCPPSECEVDENGDATCTDDCSEDGTTAYTGLPVCG